VSLDDALVEALSAIAPYLGDVVLAGGWVPGVYADVQAPLEEGALLTTRDIDVALPRRLGVRTQTIGELLEDAGFTCEFRSIDAVPVMHFVARRDEPDEVEIEFITAAAGSKDGPIEIQKGLTAQAVKFGHLLLEHTWDVALSDLTEGRMSGRLTIPTPAAFALNKSLTFPRRRDRLRREKDLYYLFYVVSGFPEWHDWMRADLRTIAESRLRWVGRAIHDLSKVSDDVYASGIDAVARQRPRGAFVALDAHQFRQYALSAMSLWLDMLREAAARS
jgi:hypothetical protein